MRTKAHELINQLNPRQRKDLETAVKRNKAAGGNVPSGKLFNTTGMNVDDHNPNDLRKLPPEEQAYGALQESTSDPEALLAAKMAWNEQSKPSTPFKPAVEKPSKAKAKSKKGKATK